MKVNYYQNAQMGANNLFKDFKQPTSNVSRYSITPETTLKEEKTKKMKKIAFAVGFTGVGLAVAAIALYKHKNLASVPIVNPASVDRVSSSLNNDVQKVATDAVDDVLETVEKTSVEETVARTVEEVKTKVQETTSEFKAKLVKSLQEKFGLTVEADSLTSIMDKNEFLKAINSLKAENYVPSEKNIEKGVFCADLRSRTLHSDGKMSVAKLLDDAVKYANELNERTNGKKKFILALTDHDNIEGTQEAIKLIAKNPDKYKNLRFVPAVELDFVHAADKSSNNFEVSELIAYGINPFDEKLNNFMNATYEKRKNFVEKFVDVLKEKVDERYSAEEFAQVYGVDLHKIHKTNIHWDLSHYGHTKSAFILDGTYLDREYPNYMTQKVGGAKSLWDLEQSYPDKRHLTSCKLIDGIRESLKPKMDENGLITNLSENRFEEVIEALNEKENVIGLAHPFYVADSKVSNIDDFVSDLIKESKGMFKLTESLHQGYKNVPEDGVASVNAMLEKLGLKPFGGRDVQEINFI